MRMDYRLDPADPVECPRSCGYLTDDRCDDCGYRVPDEEDDAYERARARGWED